jgi:FixJ family two-component response regulator
MSASLTVFLVDDDDALRKATSRLLAANGFRVRPFASAEAFLDEYRPGESGCLLLDLHMPGKSGLDLQQTLLDRGVALPIVFLTGHGDVPASVRAMKGGAIDFLQKPVEEGRLIETLESALEADQRLRAERSDLDGLRKRLESLTPREREVLQEIVTGKLNKQVALSLDIAERTVKLHRARVLEKMGAPSLADLVRMAQKLGLGPGSA